MLREQSSPKALREGHLMNIMFTHFAKYLLAIRLDCLDLYEAHRKKVLEQDRIDVISQIRAKYER